MLVVRLPDGRLGRSVYRTDRIGKTQLKLFSERLPKSGDISYY